MQNCSTENFRDKEVVNVCDGKKLGVVIELEFDMQDGRLTAIIVGGDCNLFGRIKNEITIPWCRIEKIGEDIILVNADGIVPCSGNVSKL